MNTIDTMFAFIASDDEGEGLPAFMAPNGMLMPMVCADAERIESLRPMAVRIARESGKKIQLVSFTTRTWVEDFLP